MSRFSLINGISCENTFLTGRAGACGIDQNRLAVTPSAWIKITPALVHIVEYASIWNRLPVRWYVSHLMGEFAGELCRTAIGIIGICSFGLVIVYEAKWAGKSSESLSS